MDLYSAAKLSQLGMAARVDKWLPYPVFWHKEDGLYTLQKKQSSMGNKKGEAFTQYKQIRGMKHYIYRDWKPVG